MLFHIKKILKLLARALKFVILEHHLLLKKTEHDIITQFYNIFQKSINLFYQFKSKDANRVWCAFSLFFSIIAISIHKRFWKCSINILKNVKLLKN